LFKEELFGMETENEFSDDCEFEAETEVVVFMDENNKGYEFEILDEMSVDDVKYLALLPLDDEEDDEFQPEELLIAKAFQEDGEEVLALLDDDDEFERVAKLFSDRLAEFFDIAEDDGFRHD
jgi:uncharacterized protein YrzB (UPF0473 family)